MIEARILVFKKRNNSGKVSDYTIFDIASEKEDKRAYLWGAWWTHSLITRVS